MVRLRLTRQGRSHRPFYRLNAIEKRNQRDGRVLENLGWYNPVEKDPTKQVSLKADRIKEWLGNGAQPSDTVGDLLAKHDIIDAEAWNKMRMQRVSRKAKKIVEEKQAAEVAAKEAAEAEAKAKAEEEAAAKAKAEAEAKAAAEAPAEDGEKSED